MKTDKVLRNLIREANDKFPLDTDKVVKSTLKSINAHHDKDEMIRLMVIEGIKHVLSGVRSETKYIPSADGTSVAKPIPVVRRSSIKTAVARATTRKVVAVTILDTIQYGKGTNRKKLGDATRGDLHDWVETERGQADGHLRNVDWFEAIARQLPDDKRVVREVLKAEDVEKLRPAKPKPENAHAAA